VARRFTMERKLLVAVGGPAYLQHAVRYIAKLSAAATDLTYTLFNVQPGVPELLGEAAKSDRKAKAKIGELVRANREAAGKIVQDFKEVMIQEGILDSRIETVTLPMQVGAAKDILNWAEEHGHDAVVIARREMTPSWEFSIGAVPAKVVDYGLDIPVCVVAGESTTKKILVTVDGSDNSLCAVDYLIQIVGANTDVHITLFHVIPHLRHYYSVDVERSRGYLQLVMHREDKRRMAGFYERAYERFKKAGLKSSHLNTITCRRSSDISRAIYGEAKAGPYGTVIVGRRGERGAFFSGQIARRLVHTLEDQALCIVP
jgi:nucleotide-binding universal stress UspA family protein